MSTLQYVYIFSHKNFLRSIWNKDFLKNMFIFWYSYMFSKLKFDDLGSSLLFFLSRSIHVLEFTATGFILSALWYVLLYLLIISANLSIYIFLDIEIYIIIDFVFFLVSYKSFSHNYMLNTCLYHYISLTRILLIYFKIHWLYLSMFCLICYRLMAF